MSLVCFAIPEDHVIKGSSDFMGGSPSWHHPIIFGGHRHGSSDMFLVVERQDPTCSCLNPPLMLISTSPGIICSHTRNFSFAIVSNLVSPNLVTRFLGNK